MPSANQASQVCLACYNNAVLCVNWNGHGKPRKLERVLSHDCVMCSGNCSVPHEPAATHNAGARLERRALQVSRNFAMITYR